jgi:ketosteroid isomerase-like protein
MGENEIRALMEKIQKALDTRNLPELLGYYHPEITYIGPAFPEPIHGINALKMAFESHFQTPQRTLSELVEVNVTKLGDRACGVVALIEGRQIIYYSEIRFKGWLSRIFTEIEGKPVIIIEHFTLSQ